MIKKIAIFLTLSLTVTLFGCSKPSTPEPQPSEATGATQTNGSTVPTAPTAPSDPTAATAPTVSISETMVAVSVCATTTDTTAENGAVIFQRTKQKMNLVLHKPEVAERIIIDFLTRVDSTDQAAADVETAAKSAYSNSNNWIPYFYRLTYNPTRIDQAVLSLYGDKVIYSGAAHPEHLRVAASYDLATGDALTLASIMTRDAKADDFCKLVLEGLAGRAEGDYLYENYADIVKQRFSGDASQDEAWYFSNSGLCFYFVPYEIAPYASGVIDVEIPYEKLQGLLYPAYLPAERAPAGGSIVISNFGETDVTKFSHIAELIMDQGGPMYMVYSEGTVQDVQITHSDTNGRYTVFAANCLSAGDAITVQANDATLKTLELSYKTNGETVKIPLTK
ncbi:MAG: DUF3298 domain-containing protein [Oscillospiraceae bacterium]|nr:DUF3298 domain-containing protein [Oscillospiraceae bacterium]